MNEKKKLSEIRVVSSFSPNGFSKSLSNSFFKSFKKLLCGFYWIWLVKISRRRFLKQHLCELVTKMYCNMKKSCCYFVIQVLPSYPVIEKIVKPLSTSVMAVSWDSIWLLIRKIQWPYFELRYRKLDENFEKSAVILKENTVLFCASGLNMIVVKIQD